MTRRELEARAGNRATSAANDHMHQPHHQARAIVRAQLAVFDQLRVVSMQLDELAGLLGRTDDADV